MRINGFAGNSSPDTIGGPSDCITSTGVSRTVERARICNMQYMIKEACLFMVNSATNYSYRDGKQHI